MNTRRWLLIIASLAAALALTGAALYVTNAPPVVAPIAAADLRSPRPFVVKLHAQWCTVCMVTKDAWSQIETTYAGRVNLVVLDFTTDARTNASRTEALRLGLSELYEEYGGAAGTIVVADGRTRKVTAALSGNRTFAEYQTAIEAVLQH